MPKTYTTAGMLGAVLLAMFVSGCASYKVGDQAFPSRSAAEQEHARQLNATMRGISPTASPVGGRALFVLPTMEHLEQHGIKYTGNKASIPRDQIEYVMRTEMNARESMFNALQHREIFSSLTLTHNNDPQATPPGDFDVLIYLHNPSPESAQWYIKSKGASVAQPVVVDTGKALGVPRTIAWLDSVESLARAAQPAIRAPAPAEASAPAEVRLPPPPGDRANIAVAELRSLALSADEVATLTESLRNALSETGFFNVLSSADMGAVMKHQELQRSGICDETQCLVEMGKILSVQQMVGGSVGKVGRMFSISLRLVDIETGSVVATASIDVLGEPEETLKAVRSAGKALVKNYTEKR